MDSGVSSNNKAEAERSLAIAAKLLAARDLIGAKRFAERAIDSDPLLDSDRADQILAVADVLLASQLRVNNHLDWYSILQLPHPSPSNSSPSILKRHYRRLALLLHPDHNLSSGADSAFRLIVDAYNVLSDPNKKSLFDAELQISDNLSSPPPNETAFWTACPFCSHLHQYTRAHQNKTLRCQTCRRAFHATEIQSPPPIVPGTDMYFSSWGFFPLGFPTSATSEWKPFVPMFPRSGPYESQPSDESADCPMNGIDLNTTMPGRNKKKMARKNVGSGLKKRVLVQEALNPTADGASIEKEEGRGININDEVGVSEGVGEDVERIIDLDATDDALGNLQNLPFLKDEYICIQIPKF